MFDSFKRSFGTVLGTVMGLLAGSYILSKLNAHGTEEPEDKDDSKDYVEESE